MVMVVSFSGLTLGGILSANLGAGLDAGTAVANTIQTIRLLTQLLAKCRWNTKSFWSRIYANILPPELKRIN